MYETIQPFHVKFHLKPQRKVLFNATYFSMQIFHHPSKDNTSKQYNTIFYHDTKLKIFLKHV